MDLSICIDGEKNLQTFFFSFNQSIKGIAPGNRKTALVYLARVTEIMQSK